jgi:hypothetical protein
VAAAALASAVPLLPVALTAAVVVATAVATAAAAVVAATATPAALAASPGGKRHDHFHGGRGFSFLCLSDRVPSEAVSPFLLSDWTAFVHFLLFPHFSLRFMHFGTAA